MKKTKEEKVREQELCAHILVYRANHPETQTPVYDSMIDAGDTDYMEYLEIARSVANPDSPGYQQLMPGVKIECISGVWYENEIKLENLNSEGKYETNPN